MTPVRNISPTFGADKPDPRVFTAAIEAVDVPAGRVVSVGDNLVRDVLAAVEHGLQGRWLAREGGAHECFADPRKATLASAWSPR